MKRLLYLLPVIVMAQLLIAGPVLAADTEYSSKIGSQISQNCAVIQNTLNDLRKRDISTRVARVYVYEFLLQRTQAFAQRLGNNKLSHNDIDSDNNNINNNLKNFKNDYDEYDNNLQSLSSINCQLSPQDFFNQLLLVRDQRFKLHSDVVNLQKNWQKIIDDINEVKLPGESMAPNGGGGA
jgi:hypothetical protein